MMKNFFVLATLIAAVLLPAGCAYSEIHRNLDNAEHLRIGMTKAQVRDLMGEPLDETFCTPDIWFYYVQVRWNDGLYTEDECMPLVFSGDTLVGWGNEYLARRRLVKPQEKAADKVNKETGDSLQKEVGSEVKQSRKTISF